MSKSLPLIKGIWLNCPRLFSCMSIDFDKVYPKFFLFMPIHPLYKTEKKKQPKPIKQYLKKKIELTLQKSKRTK